MSIPFLIPIFSHTASLFFLTASLKSDDPKPQFRPSYKPIETPPFRVKKPWLIGSRMFEVKASNSNILNLEDYSVHGGKELLL